MPTVRGTVGLLFPSFTYICIHIAVRSVVQVPAPDTNAFQIPEFDDDEPPLYFDDLTKVWKGGRKGRARELCRDVALLGRQEEG